MAKVKCPRCSAAIEAIKDELGIIKCSSCGARLRTKTATKMTVSTTGSSQVAGHPVTRTGRDRVMAHLDAPDPNATLRPGGPLPPVQRPAPRPPGGATGFELVLAELRQLRRTQEEILSMLRSGSGAALPELPGLQTAPPRAQRRAGSGRSVLVVDDDEDTRDAALVALQGAAMKVAAAADGNQALAAIAQDKPDVVVLELAIGGSMPGKDVINMIKATIEWVDIPIVLYTRMPVADDPESLQLHSADAIVSKGRDAPGRLLAQVGALLPQL